MGFTDLLRSGSLRPMPVAKLDGDYYRLKDGTQVPVVLP